MTENKSYRYVYDATAAECYGRTRSWSQPIPQHIAESARLTASSHLLDLACGTGNLGAAIRKLSGCRVTGVDISSDMLAQGRAKYPELTFAQGCVTDLPFGDGSFDCAAGSFFVHHLSPRDGRQCVAEAYRVLTAGTLAIVTLSQEQIRTCRLGQFFPEVIEIDLARFPALEDVQEWFSQAGFAGIRQAVVLDRLEPMGERFIEAVEKRFVSTLALLDEQAFQRGLAKVRDAVGNGTVSREPFHPPRTIVYGTKG